MSLKTTILNTPWLFRIVALVSRLIRLRIKGRYGNQISYSSLYCASKCRIVIDGRTNTIIIGEKCRFKNVVIEVRGNNNRIEIGEEVVFIDDAWISLMGTGCFAQIGSKSLLGGIQMFLEESNTSIRIGDDCMFGRNVVISTTDFHSIIDLTTNQRINKAKDIVIGNRVWVATAVDIAKGTRIADNCVVASKSMVNKKFDQSNVMLAGTPAKIVRENITWCREIL